MNTTEWKIYNLIRDNSEKSKWTSRKEIIDFLKNDNIQMSERLLRKYINNIRNDDMIQKIILISVNKNNCGYKLLSSAEELQYLKSERIKALKQLKTYFKLVRRYEKNNQCRLTFGKGYEREYIESVLKEV